MIKVNYNTKTTLVQGYYPESIKYASIPEPFIEIEESAQVLDKEMCVVNGVYQEYIKPDDVQLAEAKALKIAEIKNAAASLILTAYPTHKQLNNLMSEDSQAIEAMDIFISRIRAKSNQLEAALELLSDPEAIKNFPIEFQINE